MMRAFPPIVDERGYRAGVRTLVSLVLDSTEQDQLSRYAALGYAHLTRRMAQRLRKYESERMRYANTERAPLRCLECHALLVDCEHDSHGYVADRSEDPGELTRANAVLAEANRELRHQLEELKKRTAQGPPPPRGVTFQGPVKSSEP